MTRIPRRDFLKFGGLAAVAGSLHPATSLSVPEERPDVATQSVRFDTDGLGLTPQAYSTLLATLAGDGGIKPDYYSRGGVVEELEQKFAALLGKESAVFMPTGTLANQIALRRLAGEDRRVLVQAESHVYNDSGDCAETLSGLNLIPLAAGHATFTLDEVDQWVQRSSGGRVPTSVGVISIETPVRRRHQEMFDYEEMTKISAYARERGIRLHLDGARLFNVPHHSGRTIKEYTSLFDTVYVSLWKCFNAASGAVLAGSNEFTRELFHLRRMFGGGLPYAWPSAAVALRYADGYLKDYAAAWEVADATLSLLQKGPEIKIEKVPNGTSAFAMGIGRTAPSLFSERLLTRGIVIPQPQRDTGLFWMTVNTTLTRARARELAEWFLDAARP